MSGAGFLFVVIGVLVIGGVVWWALRSPKRSDESTTDGPSMPGGPLSIEPPVRSVEMEDDDVVVEFAVPLSEEEDERLHEILMSSAVEAVRRRRNFDVHLESGRINRIVVRSGREAVEHVGHIEIPGRSLPPPVGEVAFEIATGAAPLLEHASVDKTDAAPEFGPDELPSIGSEMGLPAEVTTALRAQGLQPKDDDAPELVRGLLKAAGYAIEDLEDDTYLALRGGDSVYVRSVAHAEGEHPELDESEVDAFLFGLARSSANEGILVSAKLVPFHLYEREHAKARLLGRQRLPGFARSMFRP